MKGTLVPTSLTTWKYTDANDQDWVLGPDMQGQWVAHLADAPNMYGKATSETVIRSDSQDHAVQSLDLWVADWNAGGNPGPQLLVDADKGKGGGGVGLLLLLGLFLVLSDDKGRRR